MGRDPKSWDELSRGRQSEIKREFMDEFRCPECDGEMFFVGPDDQTIVMHAAWCSIPARRFALAKGLLKTS